MALSEKSLSSWLTVLCYTGLCYSLCTTHTVGSQLANLTLSGGATSVGATSVGAVWPDLSYKASLETRRLQESGSEWKSTDWKKSEEWKCGDWKAKTGCTPFSWRLCKREKHLASRCKRHDSSALLSDVNCLAQPVCYTMPICPIRCLFGDRLMFVRCWLGALCHSSAKSGQV